MAHFRGCTQSLCQSRRLRLLAQPFVFPEATPRLLFCKSSSNFCFSLGLSNNERSFNGSLFEFAALSTVFTGFSLDEWEKPSKSKCAGPF
jgi:hypothetical protein